MVGIVPYQILSWIFRRGALWEVLAEYHWFWALGDEIFMQNLVSLLWAPFKKTGYARIFSWRYICLKTACLLTWTRWNDYWKVSSYIGMVLCNVSAPSKSSKKWSIFFSFLRNHGNRVGIYINWGPVSYWFLFTCPKSFPLIYDNTHFWKYNLSTNVILRGGALLMLKFILGHVARFRISGPHP